MKVLTTALGPGVNIVDQVNINPDIEALDFTNALPVFSDSASIADFNLSVNGDTVTLAGTAASPDQKNTIGSDAAKTWSNLNVVDNLTVNGAAEPPAAPGPVVPPSATPGPAVPPPVAPVPGAPPSVAPVPGVPPSVAPAPGVPPSVAPVPAPPPAPGPCPGLQDAVNSITGGPITFGNDGFSLTPADEQILGQLTDKVKTCPAAHVTVNGYTDNSGTEAINIPLSAQRAGTVADFLIGHGLASDHVTVKGLGSINPVATNDTAEGRAKNRRVEIVVS